MRRCPWPKHKRSSVVRERPGFCVTRSFQEYGLQTHPAPDSSHTYRPHSPNHTVRVAVLPMPLAGSPVIAVLNGEASGSANVPVSSNVLSSVGLGAFAGAPCGDDRKETQE